MACDAGRRQIGVDDDGQVLDDRGVAAERADAQRCGLDGGQGVDVQLREEHGARDAQPLGDGRVEPPDDAHRRHATPLPGPLRDADRGR